MMRKFCSYCHHEYFADVVGDCPFCGAYNHDDDENFGGIDSSLIDCSHCGMQLGVNDTPLDDRLCDDCSHDDVPF